MHYSAEREWMETVMFRPASYNMNVLYPRIFSDYLEFVDGVLVNNWEYNIPPGKDDGMRGRLRFPAVINGVTTAIQANEIVQLTDKGVVFTGQVIPDTSILKQDGTIFPYTPKYPFSGDNNHLSELQFIGSEFVYFDDTLGGGNHINTSKFSAASTVTPGYSGAYPLTGEYDNGQQVQNAAGRCMVVGDYLLWNYHGEFWKCGSQCNQWQVIHVSGLFMVTFGTNWTLNPNPDMYTPFEGQAGNVYATAAYMTSPGVIKIWHNDDNWHGGVHEWDLVVKAVWI